MRDEETRRKHRETMRKWRAANPGPRKKTQSRVCSVDRCDRPHQANGFCDAHYQRSLRGVPVDSQIKRVRSREDPEPTIYKNFAGYDVFFEDGKNVKAHRRVMEEFLGRPLEAHENVHHINGFRSDNRIENLELWSIQQPKGQRVEDKLAWAHEMIKMYESNEWEPVGVTW